MTIQMAETNASPRRFWRSAGAVFLGFLAVVVLSLGTDQLMHVLNVYPPWNEPMNETGDNLLALAYRCLYGVIGGYVTARFAPHSPMRHALVGGAIGFVLSTVGAIATINMNMGPGWYPILLALTALPTSWLGGVLHHKWHVH